MRHTREEVIERTILEFERLDHLVGGLTDEEWNRLLARPETKDPWTVKDTLAHITHWKADALRKIRKQPIPAEEQGLNWTDGNHLIYERWRDRSPQEVLAWHRQVQEEVLAALQAAPETWFSGRERRPDWPFDLDGHSSYHRTQDIELALEANSASTALPGRRQWGNTSSPARYTTNSAPIAVDTTTRNALSLRLMMASMPRMKAPVPAAIPASIVSAKAGLAPMSAAMVAPVGADLYNERASAEPTANRIGMATMRPTDHLPNVDAGVTCQGCLAMVSSFVTEIKHARSITDAPIVKQ
ncbi:MAG: DinB family protein [Caldilineales bacterium]